MRKHLSYDIWYDHDYGDYAVIPTNMTLRQNGNAIMGAGLALQARDRYPDLEQRYGASLRAGDSVYVDHEYRLVLVPTKDDWREPSTWQLVEDAVIALQHLELPLAIPLLGAGRGGLNSTDVKNFLILRFPNN